MGTDPIHTVLAAQAQARAEVEAGREAAGRRVAEAQTRARAIRERNERRTLRAVRHYEETCAARIQSELDGLRERGGRVEARFEKTCDAQLDAVIERAVRALWRDV